MPRSGNQTYAYAKPQPFTTPAVEERLQEDLPFSLQFLAPILPKDLIDHEQLMYSGPIIENIMFNLNREFEFRGQPNRTWKVYKSGPDDFDTFIPIGNTNGVLRESSLNGMPVKWFPLYIRDMQEAITELMGLGGIPDDIGSAMARIFGNKTAGGPGGWNGQNRIRPSYVLPGQTASDLTTYNVSLNSFPFPAESTIVTDPGVRMGIDFRGKAYVRRGRTAIQTSDSEWPRSVIGKRRTEDDVTIDEGFLEEKEGSTVTGIDGVHLEMTEAGRPEQFRQVGADEALLVGSVGQPDVESGYSWFAHHPYVLQQCRYQPPLIETWGDRATVCKDYVENVFSNQTPNLPWYFSQEVEKQHFGDWGGWIIQGEGCLTGNGVRAKAYADPQHAAPITNCPFSVFYPPPSSNCSCIDAVNAYAIWTSSNEPLIWNLRTWFNFGQSARAKLFGPRTRLRVSGTMSATAGVGGGAAVFVSLRTARISSVNLQPFVPVLGIGGGNIPFPGSFDVNLFDAMKHHYPYYGDDGVDAILAIGIFAGTSTDVRATVEAEDGPTGSFIPETNLGCLVGTSEFNLQYLQLYEPPLDVESDIRLPTVSVPPLQEPPTYNLPQSSS